MSPTCLVPYSPMLTTADTETFRTTIKSQSQEEGRGLYYLEYCILCVNASHYWGFIIACKLKLSHILRSQVQYITV